LRYLWIFIERICKFERSMASNDEHNLDSESLGRRELLKAMAGASGWAASRLLLPAAWSAPVLASMALPAHAQMSSPNSEPPEPPEDEPEAAGTGPNDAAIVATVEDSTVTLTVWPPAALISNRTQYQVYERLDDTKASPVTKFVRVVGLMTPSADATLSGSVSFELSRAAGRYEYQLRWPGGHTAWVEVTVP
jgi:hypothetical protein